MKCFFHECSQSLLMEVWLLWDNRARCARFKSGHVLTVLGKNADWPLYQRKESLLRKIHCWREEPIATSVRTLVTNYATTMLHFWLVIVKTWTFCFLVSFYNILSRDTEFSPIALTSILLHGSLQTVKG